MIERKYILLCSNRLNKFKPKGANLFNFRCPLCNDSKTSSTKARGYFFQKKGDYWFYCHNCQVSLIFPRFLKQFDSGLYEHYLKEKLQDTNHTNIIEEYVNRTQTIDIQLPSLLELSKDHIARIYIENRRIPLEFFDDIFLVDKFKEWTNSFIPEKFDLKFGDETRLIIPFRDQTNIVFGYQGRDLKPNSLLRYITIMVDETKPKLWGLHRVNFNYKYYVVEGPFDAMFLPNCIATAGGKISSDLIKIGCNLANAVIVYDNEPRNKNICDAIHKAIVAGFRVVIWPQNIKEKDINDMVLANKSIEQIKTIIDTNTYHGLEARTQLSSWRRI